MLRFVISRLGLIVLAMLLVTFCTTLLAGLIPGSPAFAIYGQVPLSFARAWNKSHGLDNSIWVQYWHWLSDAFHGNLGTSWASGGTESVSFLMGQRIPVTAEIAVVAIVVSLLIAIPVAMVAASRQNGVIDRFVTGVASIWSASPPFVSGVILVALLADHWRLLPSEGFVSIGTSLGQNLKGIELPVITLVFVVAPLFIRVLRGDLVSILNEDFVSAARSRGIPEWYILTCHVLRPASASLVTVAGLSFGYLLGGSIIVEVFYGIPGLGNLAFDAVNNKDIPVLQGIVVCVSLFFIVVNTVVELLYRILDPRVRIT